MEPFHTKIDFKEADGQFSGYTVTLTQAGRTFVMDSASSAICHDETYLHAMTDDISGNMAITMSIWAAHPIDWLQHGACTGECTTDSTHTIFNIKVTTAEFKKATARAAAEFKAASTDSAPSQSTTPFVSF